MFAVVKISIVYEISNVYVKSQLGWAFDPVRWYGNIRPNPCISRAFFEVWENGCQNDHILCDHSSFTGILQQRARSSLNFRLHAGMWVWNEQHLHEQTISFNFDKTHFVFTRKSIKINENPFDMTKSRTLFRKDPEGHFTHWKKRTRFFRTKGFIQIFDGFFLKTKGFLPKVYEIFWEWNAPRRIPRSETQSPQRLETAAQRLKKFGAFVRSHDESSSSSSSSSSSIIHKTKAT